MSGANLGSYLEMLRCTLGDALPDCQHWEDDLLLGYLRTAIAFLADHRPELFAETITMTVVAGSKQMLPEGYTRLVSVCTDTGATPSENFHGDSSVVSHLICLNKCKPGESGDSAHAPVTGYSVNPHNPAQFNLSPAPDTSGQIIEVQAVPDLACVEFNKSDKAPFPAELGMALCEYVLYKALLADRIESPRASQLSAQHFSNFLLLTQLGYLQDQRLGSGYYNGQEGSGDPAFRSR